MSGTIEYELNDKGYGVITLQRPEKRNAISVEMVHQLKEILEKAKEDPIKFLMVTGAGDRMFCAGGDLYNLHGELASEEAFAILYPMKEALYELLSFPVPTVCLLNGDAVGGGCEIATACDFRIAVENTKFGFVQSTLGITPGWGGGALLYEKINPSFAFNWLLKGEVYDASYLQNWGWVHQIISRQELADIDKLLEDYIVKSLEQMKVLKLQYKKKLSSLAISALMNEEVRNCANLWDTPEHKEAVQRIMSKK